MGDFSTEGRGRLDATKVNHMSCVQYRKLDIPWFVKGSRHPAVLHVCDSSETHYLPLKTRSADMASPRYFKNQKMVHALCQSSGSSYLLLPVDSTDTEHHTGPTLRRQPQIRKCVTKLFFFFLCKTVKTYHNWLRWGYLRKKKSQSVKWF